MGVLVLACSSGAASSERGLLWPLSDDNLDDEEDEDEEAASIEVDGIPASVALTTKSLISWQ